MLRITGRYAKALVKYAEPMGLEDIYRQILMLDLGSSFVLEMVPEQIKPFTAIIPGGKSEVSAVLREFIALARKELNLLSVEVISAVPLTEEQMGNLERKLVRILHKQLDMTNTVDPSIIGGLRVMAGEIVLDDSIKRKLMSMKTSIYEGVYFK